MKLERYGHFRLIQDIFILCVRNKYNKILLLWGLLIIEINRNK